MTDELHACDRVFDKHAIDDEDETPELAIVIGRRDHTCGEHEIEDDGDTVHLHEYGVNTEYATPDDPVVTIVFTSWLNGNIPQWDEHADDIDGLIERMHMMRDDYQIPVDRHLYDYPASRLSLRVRP